LISGHDAALHKEICVIASVEIDFVIVWLLWWRMDGGASPALGFRIRLRIRKDIS
jgi:hypothetical protein